MSTFKVTWPYVKGMYEFFGCFSFWHTHLLVYCSIFSFLNMPSLLWPGRLRWLSLRVWQLQELFEKFWAVQKLRYDLFIFFNIPKFSAEEGVFQFACSWTRRPGIFLWWCRLMVSKKIRKFLSPYHHRERFAYRDLNIKSSYARH